MQIIDGKSLATKLRQEIGGKVRLLDTKPGLAVILVGNDPASHLYVSLKEKACAEAGIHFEKYLFEASEPEQNIIKQILSLNTRRNINAILLQLPLPSHYNTDKIITTINPQKDVDGFHCDNLNLLQQDKHCLIPVTTKAAMALIQSTGVDLKGKLAVILANSEIFSMPIKFFLESHGVATKIIIYNPSTPLSEYTDLPQADILITAIGRAKAVTADLIKDGAIVIDVGTNRINCGTEEMPCWKTMGDVDPTNLPEKNGFYTPVPGGVGPVTVAMLLQNILQLQEIQTHQ